MATPEPGELLRHVHSKILYWLIGKIPGTQLVAISMKDNNQKVYSIGQDELRQYYEVVPYSFEKMATYRHPTHPDATFTVEEIYTNPDTDEEIAFGWYRRTATSDAIANTIRTSRIEEFEVVNYEPSS